MAEAATLSEAEGPTEGHELTRLFAAHGLALNGTLVEMLNEHFSHRTERRGCGFTQASRHLAALVNQRRENIDDTIAALFPDMARGRAAGAPATLSSDGEGEARSLSLRRVLTELEREESRIFVSLVTDLVSTAGPAPGVPELAPYAEQLKVGTCPLAEKYFLEIGNGFVRRRGRANVLVSEGGRPLLVEKVGLGDDHSCISVATLTLNGVRLPPGCLFAVHYEGAVAQRDNRALLGSIIRVDRCAGFRFLRLTTLCVSPQHRERAFSTHFRSQLAAGLFAPGETTIDQLRRVAEDQL